MVNQNQNLTTEDSREKIFVHSRLPLKQTLEYYYLRY